MKNGYVLLLFAIINMLYVTLISDGLFIKLTDDKTARGDAVFGQCQAIERAPAMTNFCWVHSCLPRESVKGRANQGLEGGVSPIGSTERERLETSSASLVRIVTYLLGLLQGN